MKTVFQFLALTNAASPMQVIIQNYRAGVRMPVRVILERYSSKASELWLIPHPLDESDINFKPWGRDEALVTRVGRGWVITKLWDENGTSGPQIFGDEDDEALLPSL